MGRAYRGVEERIRLYDEVMKLRSRGLSSKQIARAIEERHGISLNPGMICNWIKGKYHPLGRCNKIIEGAGLAYALGGWLGDGSLNEDSDHYKYCIRLSCNDYDFAEEWGRCLAEALGRSKPYVPKWDDRYERWVVKGSSLLLYKLLKRAREDPWILMPYLEEYPGEACRGFFDAEGWVNVKRYMIAVGNTDPNIIDLFKKLLERLDIDCRRHQCRQNEIFISPRAGKLYHRNSGFITYLAIYRKENILRFAERVGFTIARKRVKLMELVRKYHKI